MTGNNEKPPRPEPPPADSCCQGGCFPCVHDYYRWAVEDWEKDVAAMPPGVAEDPGPRPGGR